MQFQPDTNALDINEFLDMVPVGSDEHSCEDSGSNKISAVESETKCIYTIEGVAIKDSGSCSDSDAEVVQGQLEPGFCVGELLEENVDFSAGDHIYSLFNIEEPSNQSNVVGSDDTFGTGIKRRTRQPQNQLHAQNFETQGTAMRRICWMKKLPRSVLQQMRRKIYSLLNQSKDGAELPQDLSTTVDSKEDFPIGCHKKLFCVGCCSAGLSSGGTVHVNSWAAAADGLFQLILAGFWLNLRWSLAGILAGFLMVSQLPYQLEFIILFVPAAESCSDDIFGHSFLLAATCFLLSYTVHVCCSCDCTREQSSCCHADFMCFPADFSALSARLSAGLFVPLRLSAGHYALLGRH
ncbi:unnamed protein product [Ilex paraguariensis]|uniref:Uncharacterized protein n=1 Tax=Ilex paraguariensis TaxID=185542 RepID=A0ABC8S1M9_9AQUA